MGPPKKIFLDVLVSLEWLVIALHGLHGLLGHVLHLGHGDTDHVLHPPLRSKIKIWKMTPHTHFLLVLPDRFYSFPINVFMTREVVEVELSACWYTAGWRSNYCFYEWYFRTPASEVWGVRCLFLFDKCILQLGVSRTLTYNKQSTQQSGPSEKLQFEISDKIFRLIYVIYVIYVI